MFGAPPKPAIRSCVIVELLPWRSICSVEPMNRSVAYSPATWQYIRFDPIEPSRPLK